MPFFLFALVSTSCFGVDVTFGFDAPIQGYIEQIKSKTTWHYIGTIFYPNKTKKIFNIPNELAKDSNIRIRLGSFNIIDDQRSFKMILSCGNTLANIFYNHELAFNIPEDIDLHQLRKVRIFAHWDMRPDEHILSARIEYESENDDFLKKATPNPLSFTKDNKDIDINE